MNAPPPEGATVGGPWMDAPLDVAPAKDGGFIAAGVSDYHATGDADLHVARLDAAGNIMWERRFGGRDFDYAATVAQDAGGGFFVAGAVRELKANRYDILLLKLDASGKREWERIYGGSREDTPVAMLPLADGGLALAANTSSRGRGKSDVWLMRLDKNGGILWERTFGGPQRDSVSAVAQTQNDGFILAGTTESFGPGVEKESYDPSYRFTSRARPANFYVIVLDKTGNLVWERTYGGALIADNAVALTAAADGYALAGTAAWLPNGGSCDLRPRNRIRLTHIDAAGNVIWDNTYGADDRDETAAGVSAAGGGGYLVAGTARPYGGGDADVITLAIDEAGAQVAAHSCGGARDDIATASAALENGRPLIAARTRSFGRGHWDDWFTSCSGTTSAPPQ